MSFVSVGKVVSTHGIKGEIRIISDKAYTINSYRVHKHFDMVTFEGFTNINEVLFLLKKEVFFKKEELNLSDDEILDEDLIQYNVLTKEGKRGIIKEIFMASESNKILRVLFDKEVLIPMNSPMIVEISKDKKQVIVQLIEGME